jgi:hypothetical protein
MITTNKISITNPRNKKKISPCKPLIKISHPSPTKSHPKKNLKPTNPISNNPLNPNPKPNQKKTKQPVKNLSNRTSKLKLRSMKLQNRWIKYCLSRKKKKIMVSMLINNKIMKISNKKKYN